MGPCMKTRPGPSSTNTLSVSLSSDISETMMSGLNSRLIDVRRRGLASRDIAAQQLNDRARNRERRSNYIRAKKSFLLIGRSGALQPHVAGQAESNKRARRNISAANATNGLSQSNVTSAQFVKQCHGDLERRVLPWAGLTSGEIGCFRYFPRNFREM